MGAWCGCGLDDRLKSSTIANEIETDISRHVNHNENEGKISPPIPQRVLDHQRNKALTPVVSQGTVTDETLPN